MTKPKTIKDLLEMYNMDYKKWEKVKIPIIELTTEEFNEKILHLELKNFAPVFNSQEIREIAIKEMLEQKLSLFEWYELNIIDNNYVENAKEMK